MRNIGMLLRRRAAPARVAATVSILFGLASLTGWLLGIQALTSVIPESVEMKANTALCVAASGIALLMLANGASTRLDRLAQILSAAVAAVGLATLAEYLFGVDLGIDEFLVRDTRSVYNICLLYTSRTAIPLGPATAPGCDEPTSRCQTPPSMWTLGRNKPVIPGVPFIR